MGVFNFYFFSPIRLQGSLQLPHSFPLLIEKIDKQYKCLLVHASVLQCKHTCTHANLANISARMGGAS